MLGLLLQRHARGRSFFDERGILLCELVHMRNSLVDLPQAATLLIRGLTDAHNHLTQTTDGGHCFFHRATGRTHQPAA